MDYLQQGRDSGHLQPRAVAEAVPCLAIFAAGKHAAVGCGAAVPSQPQTLAVG